MSYLLTVLQGVRHVPIVANGKKGQGEMAEDAIFTAFVHFLPVSDDMCSVHR
ncbi:hypothetical protein BCBMB205_23850 [Bacillus sp. CN2]|nr:hypothetical protein BCBMB205_23850 [Bacillus velezensis]ARZ58725.1 hypothetical protein BAGQ_2492 [Bacillus velezensis]GFR55996.1 hypothetical protein BCBMB205_23850 [Bacillus sp. CN2]